MSLKNELQSITSELATVILAGFTDTLEAFEQESARKFEAFTANCAGLLHIVTALHFDALNQERAAKGLEPLEPNDIEGVRVDLAELHDIAAGALVGFMVLRQIGEVKEATDLFDLQQQTIKIYSSSIITANKVEPQIAQLLVVFVLAQNGRAILGFVVQLNISSCIFIIFTQISNFTL